jgi:hypothetical protein
VVGGKKAPGVVDVVTGEHAASSPDHCIADVPGIRPKDGKDSIEVRKRSIFVARKREEPDTIPSRVLPRTSRRHENREPIFQHAILPESAAVKIEVNMWRALILCLSFMCRRSQVHPGAAYD